jgi:hypothetical protein
MIESTKPTTLSNLATETNACSNLSILQAAVPTSCRDRFVDQSERIGSGVDDSLLIDVEKTLTGANREAVRASDAIEHSSPLVAKAILLRGYAEGINPPHRIVRTDLARSLAHTLAHLS